MTTPARWVRPGRAAGAAWGGALSLLLHGSALLLLGWALVPPRLAEPLTSTGVEMVWAAEPGPGGEGAMEAVAAPGPPPSVPAPPPPSTAAPPAPVLAALGPPALARPALAPPALAPLALAPPALAPPGSLPTPDPRPALAEAPPARTEPPPQARSQPRSAPPRQASRSAFPRSAAPDRSAPDGAAGEAGPPAVTRASMPGLGAGSAAAGPTAPPTADAGFRNAAPAYPETARARGQQGRVTLELSVDAQGRVAGAQVVRGSGFPILDAAAQRAVLGWRFRPALEGGRPVAARMRSTVQFRLE